MELRSTSGPTTALSGPQVFLLRTVSVGVGRTLFFLVRRYVAVAVTLLLLLLFGAAVACFARSFASPAPAPAVTICNANARTAELLDIGN